MCRRALTRNIRKIAPPPEVAAKYLLFWAQGELYANPDQFPDLTSATIFGNDHPLELEVGCGTG
jgi:tRNA (guanine-N7-)-methyltransferase